MWVSAVEAGPVESSVSNTRAGTIKACRRSKLSMPMGGVVDRLLVKEGDEVKQGQLLLELWNRDRKADLVQAEQSFKAVKNDAKSAPRINRNILFFLQRSLYSDSCMNISGTYANV